MFTKKSFYQGLQEVDDTVVLHGFVLKFSRCFASLTSRQGDLKGQTGLKTLTPLIRFLLSNVCIKSRDKVETRKSENVKPEVCAAKEAFLPSEKNKYTNNHFVGCL